MGSTQDLYAANLLQHCGYPLHSPGPRDGLEEQYQTEGFQIGDVGYINSEGEFNPLFNICSPLPDELRKRKFPEHKPVDFEDSYRKPHALVAGHVFMTGVNQEVDPSSPGVAYKFTAESNAGAVLILPSGATLLDLPQDKSYSKPFRMAADKYARLWCECAEQQSLYLVTGMYKTRDFILTSFNTGRPDQEMLVKTVAGKYEWKCGFTAYSRISPPNNKPENQTILIKGFRMTVRWSCLPVVERVTQPQSRFGRWFASLIAILTALLYAAFEMSSTWLSWISIEHIPPLTRLLHPSDSINHYLLDKNPRALVAITHDDEWIDILEKKRLSPEDLMREDRLRAFLEREYSWDSDSDVVYLRSQIGNTNQPNQNSASQLMSVTENVQVVITHMRAENVTVGLERVPVGFYVQVDIDGCPRSQTKNKTMLVYDRVIQWDDVIHLPSDPSIVVKLTVCASHEFSPMLGKGEPLHELEKTVGELLTQTGALTFHDKQEKDLSPCASLLVAVQLWHCKDRTLDSNEVDVTGRCPTEVTKPTNEGHEALRRYYADHSEKYLEDSVSKFDNALSKCLDEFSYRAAALFNLATAEFITHRSYGTWRHFKGSVDHYQEALELRRDDHQDRPMTLLYLAQVFLYRSSTMGLDAPHDDKLSELLNELKNICPEGTHGRRATDVVLQTHELLGLRDSNDLGKLNELISTLHAAAQEPPDAYFDMPARFENLGLALHKRFKLGPNAADLDRAVEWFRKAVEFPPTNHLDKSEHLCNLGDALLVRSQRKRAVPFTGKN